MMTIEFRVTRAGKTVGGILSGCGRKVNDFVKRSRSPRVSKGGEIVGSRQPQKAVRTFIKRDFLLSAF
jgi:hypothetical protein